jgi:hypothetical protein
VVDPLGISDADRVSLHEKCDHPNQELRVSSALASTELGSSIVVDDGLAQAWADVCGETKLPYLRFLNPNRFNMPSFIVRTQRQSGKSMFHIGTGGIFFILVTERQLG